MGAIPSSYKDHINNMQLKAHISTYINVFINGMWYLPQNNQIFDNLTKIIIENNQNTDVFDAQCIDKLIELKKILPGLTGDRPILELGYRKKIDDLQAAICILL